MKTIFLLFIINFSSIFQDLKAQTNLLLSSKPKAISFEPENNFFDVYTWIEFNKIDSTFEYHHRCGLIYLETKGNWSLIDSNHIKLNSFNLPLDSLIIKEYDSTITMINGKKITNDTLRKNLKYFDFYKYDTSKIIPVYDPPYLTRLIFNKDTKNSREFDWDGFWVIDSLTSITVDLNGFCFSTYYVKNQKSNVFKIIFSEDIMSSDIIFRNKVWKLCNDKIITENGIELKPNITKIQK